MPLTPVLLGTRQSWTKHALERLHMAPLDPRRLLPTGVTITSIDNIEISWRPAQNAPWQDMTRQFLGGPGTPDPTLPEPTVNEAGNIVIWLRAAENNEQRQRDYTIAIDVTLSDGQRMRFTHRLGILDSAR